MTYIVVSENEIVKAEMERPSFSAWEIINPCVNKDRLIKPFQEHCLSLPRIAIHGKHNWKVWQEVEEREIKWQYQYCKQDNIYRWFNCEKNDHIGWPKHLCRIIAIPIQPTPEGDDKFIPPDHGDVCWNIGAETFTRKEVAYLLWTQRAMIGNDLKASCGNDMTKEMFAILDKPRKPVF